MDVETLALFIFVVAEVFWVFFFGLLMTLFFFLRAEADFLAWGVFFFFADFAVAMNCPPFKKIGRFSYIEHLRIQNILILSRRKFSFWRRSKFFWLGTVFPGFQPLRWMPNPGIAEGWDLLMGVHPQFF
ncbi:MAG: hypothetical protein NTY64_09335 [Deltaproteobacteria bacterium]|nr:hypothetical protein [Deltaproteobacteria bacterium]